MRFNKRYKIYLDTSVPSGLAWNNDTDATWYEVYPDIEPFKKSPVQGEMFERYAWGSVNFRNETEYAGNSSQVYYTVKNLALTQEVRIKIVIDDNLIKPDSIDTTDSETVTIRGYFGKNDCDFDDDKKIFKVTPSILDQYTDLLENYETDVVIFPKAINKTGVWILSGDYANSHPSGISSTHNLPLTFTGGTLNEGNSPVSTSGVGIVNSVLKYLENNYTATFSITINATATISISESMDFIISEYDSSDSLVSETIIGGLNEMTNGNVAVTYSPTISLTKGSYVRITNQVSSTSDTIDYSSITVDLLAVVVPFSTNTLSLNIKSEYQADYDIWASSEYGSSDSTKINDWNADIPSLATLFNANGSPKEDLLKGASGGTRYSPRSQIKRFVTNIPGAGTIEIHQNYIADIENSLRVHKLELSEVTVYKHKWDRLLAADRYICLAHIKFSRFEQYVTDGDTPVGTGWEDSGYVDANNKRLYIKEPFDGVDYGWTKGSIEGSGTIGGVAYEERLTSTKITNYPDSNSSVDVQSRSLHDVIKNIYNNTFSSLLNFDVESTFFWNDADSNITVDSGINYVTNETNWLNNIECVHTAQFKNTSVNSDEDVLKITFKKMMEELKILFNYQIFWFVEEDGTLKLEHLYYIDQVKSPLDVSPTADPSTYYDKNSDLLTEISSWSYDKDRMYSLISFEIANSGYKDFTDNKITFDKIVSNKRNEDIRNPLVTSILSTDAKYCVENPADLENGMLLVNHNSYTMLNANVPLAGIDFENGNLALSNLLNRYKYEGVFTLGKINNTSVEFDITSRTQIGKEFLLRGIYNYGYFKNILGVGRIDSITHDLDRETTTVTLRYRYGAGGISDQFILMVTNDSDYVGATDIMFNFG